MNPTGIKRLGEGAPTRRWRARAEEDTPQPSSRRGPHHPRLRQKRKASIGKRESGEGCCKKGGGEIAIVLIGFGGERRDGGPHGGQGEPHGWRRPPRERRRRRRRGSLAPWRRVRAQQWVRRAVRCRGHARQAPHRAGALCLFFAFFFSSHTPHRHIPPRVLHSSPRHDTTSVQFSSCVCSLSPPPSRPPSSPPARRPNTHHTKNPTRHHPPHPQLPINQSMLTM